MEHVIRLASVAIIGLASLNISSEWLRAQSPAGPTGLQACPSAGTYTATVDGAPAKGACRQFVDQMEPTSYTIPSGKLFDALKAYLQQSGARGWVPFDIMVAKICDSGGRNCKTDAIETAGVSGLLPPREALDQLLGGTGVTYVQDQTGTFRFPKQEYAVAGGRCTWNKEPPNACAGQ